MGRLWNSLDEFEFQDEGLPLKRGDIVLLASDGLETLTEHSSASLLSQHADWDAADMARALLSAVVSAGRRGQDNTSVMVVRVV